MASDNPAARLQEMRQILGHSQRAMAAAAGISEATWQRMEAGALPTGETLMGIAALGFSPTWVLTGQGPMRLGETAAPTAPAPPAAPSRLYGTVKIDWLEEAFREALDRIDVDPAELGDPLAVMAMTLLLYDARAQKAAPEKAQPETKPEKVLSDEKTPG